MTIFEELAERAKEDVEVHIPPVDGHDEVIPREELMEEANTGVKDDLSQFLVFS